MRNVKIERNSWDHYFILQCFLVSTRSLDAQTQHGCVLVDDNKNIVSTGYNSFIRNINDAVLPNTREFGKYTWMIHSENNAILSCSSRGQSTSGLTAYITGPPCINCLQYMYQSGIKKIIYYNQTSHMMATDEAKKNEELLKSLIDIEITEIEKNVELDTKISQIKSCR